MGVGGWVGGIIIHPTFGEFSPRILPERKTQKIMDGRRDAQVGDPVWVENHEHGYVAGFVRSILPFTVVRENLPAILKIKT